VINQRELFILAAAIMLCSVIMFGLHDRHYRRRRDTVRDARIRAIERSLSPEAQHDLLRSIVAAHEEILLEDETT